MVLLGRKLTSLLLGSTVVLGLAAACGSDDDKKVASGGDGGRDGAGEAGEHAGGTGLTDAGAPSAPEGGGGSAVGGDGGMATGAGMGPGGGAGATGDAGAPPAGECAPSGNVTNLDVNPEPIYSACRGAVLRVPFAATAAPSEFVCCGASTSDTSFALPINGTFNGEDGGTLELRVPSNAPYGTYGLQLDCQTQPNDQAIAISVSDSDAPVVLSISALVSPTSTMRITGQHLSGVTRVGAVRPPDPRYYECIVDPDGQSDTEISCNFDGEIPVSADATDLYFIDVEADNCGHAADPPPFLVVAEPG